MHTPDTSQGQNQQRAHFSGIQIDCLSLEESLQKCAKLIDQRGHQHVVVNAAKVILSNDDPSLKDIINDCSLVNIDGQSVVWALRLLGYSVPHRVAGIDLMHSLIETAPLKKWRVALLGASEAVVEKVADTFRSQGVELVYVRNGFWLPQEEEDVVREISHTAPDLLFIAVPSPKKEYFLAQHLSSLNVGLAFGVGGSFDIVAGRTKRAPKYFQNLGLEWLYRLLQEPKRMFKRYLIGNSRFALVALRSIWNQRILGKAS